VLSAPLVHAGMRYRILHMASITLGKRPLVEQVFLPFDRLKAGIQRLTIMSVPHALTTQY
jgi:hypothetical protein